MHSENVFPCDILMVEPDYFRVEYRINPYMTDENGNLNEVNKEKAREQWDALLSVFVGLKMNVKTIKGDEKYPDMVFVANQSFPFISEKGPSLLMSKMNSSHRQGEVALIEQWGKEQGLHIFHLSSEHNLEGTGDMIWDPYHNRVFGGFGYRTDCLVYDEVEKITGHKVVRLKLVSPHFYHLDTCFSVLNSETVLYVEDAFDHEGRQIIKDSFKNVIAITEAEAKESFVGNCFCPDGKNVVTNLMSEKIKKEIESFGFNIIEVDTSEFMKSGGSVFCMKLALLSAR